MTSIRKSLKKNTEKPAISMPVITSASGTSDLTSTQPAKPNATDPKTSSPTTAKTVTRRSTRSASASHLVSMAAATPSNVEPIEPQMEPQGAADIDSNTTPVPKKRRSKAGVAMGKEAADVQEGKPPQKLTRQEAVIAAKEAANAKREEARKKKEENQKKKEENQKKKEENQKKKEENQKKKEENQKKKDEARKKKEEDLQKKALEKADKQIKHKNFTQLEADMDADVRKHSFPSLFKVQRNSQDLYNEREFSPTTEQYVNDSEVEETLYTDNAEDGFESDGDGDGGENEAEPISKYVTITPAKKRNSMSMLKDRDIEMSAVPSDEDEESPLVSDASVKQRERGSLNLTSAKISEPVAAKAPSKRKGDESAPGSVIDIAKKQKVLLTVPSDDTEIVIEDDIEDYFVRSENDIEMWESSNLTVSNLKAAATRTMNITDGFKGHNSEVLKLRADAGK